MPSNSKGRLGRWAIVVATITGLMLFAIALYLLTNSERRLRAIDERNAADLATIVDNLEQWPAAASAIATQNAFETESAARGGSGSSQRSGAADSAALQLYHPDFGQYKINYTLTAKCEAFSKLNFGAKAVFSFAGEVENDRNDGQKLLPELRPKKAVEASADGQSSPPQPAVSSAGANRICYRLDLPLERMIKLEQTAPGLRTILIAESDKTVLQQIGIEKSLPINSVADLHEEDSPYASALRTLATKDDAKPMRVAGIEAPINARIGNKVYRVYVRNFSLGSSDGSKPMPYSAVGVVDRSTMVANGPRTPMKWIIVFTFAFALLLALTPSLKLLLLGPVEALGPIEVVGIGGGLIAAAAIATATIGLGASVLTARYDADKRIATTAQWMAREIDQEIVSILGPPHCSLAQLAAPLPRPDCIDSQGLALATKMLGETDLYTRSVQPKLDRAAPPIDFERPESAFVANNGGEQYSTLATRRDQAGGRAYVTGRDYFDRIKSGDLLTRTVAKAQAFTAAGETFASNRYTIGRVLARPDGLMKSIVTIPVDKATPGETAASALTFAWVSKPLLAPALPSGIEFAVVDLASADLLVLAHSIPNRPQIERARFAFDAAGVAAIEGLAHTPQPACGDALAEPVRFSASYDGRTRHFAALRVPCTTWAVLTNVDLDRLDAQSAKEALWALVGWSSLVVAAGLILASRAALGWETRFMVLWPNPRLLPAYERRSKRLRALCLGSAIAILAFALLSRYVTGVWMVAFAVPMAGGFILFRRPPADETSTPTRLTPVVEDAYLRCLFAAMTCFAIVPVTALMIDAHQDMAARRAHSALVEEAQRVDARFGQMLAVARTYYPDIRDGAPAGTDRASWGGSPRIGDYRLPARRSVVPDMTYTAGLRTLVAEPSTNVPHMPPPRAAPADAPPGHIATTGWCALLALAIAFLVFLRYAARRVLAALFGFGVPLKAVDYPEIPAGLWSVFSERTMIVAAPDHIRRAITDEPRILKIDLFNPGKAGVSDRILVTNLELVLQNDTLRLAALVLLEALVESQDQYEGKSSIVVLSSLPPLERLLHGYDRVNDTADFYTLEEERLRRRKFSEDGEALRWSRLFESFDTYYSQDRPVEVSAYQLDSFTDPCQRKIAATVYRELDYLPLSVLETGLPEARDGTDLAKRDDGAATPDASASPEISRARERRAHRNDRAFASALKQRWAEKLSGKRSLGIPAAAAIPTPAAGPRAVIDYFAALFIEHYQLAWSASSHGERLLLYHLAHGRFVNIERAYQLGPLVRRGLVMLNPELQLLNRSFAQFVRHAENPDTLATWRDATPKSAWSRAQVPVMLAIALGLCVLLVSAAQSGDSMASYVPVLIGAVPALLHSLGLMRKSGQ